LANQTSVQICWFVAIIAVLWLAETRAFPQAIAAKSLHSSLNAIFILSALPIQIGMMLLCAGVARWALEHHWGLVYLLPSPEHPLIKYGLMFLVLDFLDYVYHVTMHHVAPFWRFHLVHHTDQAVDVSTTVREHPGETLIRNSFLILWVFLCGASVEILLLRQIADTAANLSAHTSVRLRPRAARVLGWLFITPNLHHVHHHFEKPATNRNYGDVFSIWDRLFGTFTNLAREDTVFGLETHMDGAIDTRLRKLLANGRALLPQWSRS
jgi:sterol desaturase/sphingolipid hydroxylase (fatty acid hydroxylase superfamily)